MRRFLRFKLRTLLLLPAVFAFGWFWWTWPQRTLQAFVVAAQNSPDVEFESIFGDVDCRFVIDDVGRFWYGPRTIDDKQETPLRIASFARLEPTFLDVLKARRDFIVAPIEYGHWPSRLHPLVITVSRGIITAELREVPMARIQMAELVAQ